MEFDYEIVDVFTDTAFEGNPLAVVYGTEGLEDAALQALAREFNLSETAFPWPATEDGATYRLRICTPSVELPFAGHPSVGAAWALKRRGEVTGDRVVQQCGAGLLPLVFEGDEVTLTGGTPTSAIASPAAAEAVGLTAADLVAEPRRCGTGLEFTYLLVDEGVVDTCKPDPQLLAELGGGGVSVSSWSDGAAYTRVFAGGVGVDEDPATGSAGLGFGVFAVGSGLLPAEGRSDYVITQGVRMGRRSILRGRVTAAAGAVREVSIRGGVVPVAKGTIRRP